MIISLRYMNQTMQNKISQRVQELFDKGHLYDDIFNINIKKTISTKLLPYQTLHTFNMITALKTNKIVIDCSHTGTGKTYTTAAVCAHLNLTPLVVCPKSIIHKWKEVLNIFNVKYINIVNYETLRNGKYYDEKWNKIKCPYLEKTKNGFEWNFISADSSSKYKNKNNIVIIFDEVHRCKNYNSANGKLLISCKSCKSLKTIMLSATLCDKINDFCVFGMMLGFYKNYKQGKNWIESIIREDSNQYGKKKINTLHKYLFPDKGSKMCLEDLGDSFPMNQISIDCYTLDDPLIKKINDYYDMITKENDNNNDNVLPNLIAMRQKIENLKSGIMIELMMEYYEQNKSVALFVNYRSTHNIIIDYLIKNNIEHSFIHGDQDNNERNNAVNLFQNNSVRIIIVMIQAGGTSISLHDTWGYFPRVSIISPSYSSIELMQTLGRIYRAGVKSPCLQKIIYCANTQEEEVANILRKKKNFLNIVTDDDTNIEQKNIINTSNKNKKKFYTKNNIQK